MDGLHLTGYIINTLLCHITLWLQLFNWITSTHCNHFDLCLWLEHYRSQSLLRRWQLLSHWRNPLHFMERKGLHRCGPMRYFPPNLCMHLSYSHMPHPSDLGFINLMNILWIIKTCSDFNLYIQTPPWEHLLHYKLRTHKLNLRA